MGRPKGSRNKVQGKPRKAAAPKTAAKAVAKQARTVQSRVRYITGILSRYLAGVENAGLEVAEIHYDGRGRLQITVSKPDDESLVTAERLAEIEESLAHVSFEVDMVLLAPRDEIYHAEPIAQQPVAAQQPVETNTNAIQ